MVKKYGKLLNLFSWNCFICFLTFFLIICNLPVSFMATNNSAETVEDYHVMSGVLFGSVWFPRFNAKGLMGIQGKGF